MDIYSENFEGLSMYDYPEMKASIDPDSVIPFIMGLGWQYIKQRFAAQNLFDIGALRFPPVDLSSPESLLR